MVITLPSHSQWLFTSYLSASVQLNWMGFRRSDFTIWLVVPMFRVRCTYFVQLLLWAKWKMGNLCENRTYFTMENFVILARGWVWKGTPLWSCFCWSVFIHTTLLFTMTVRSTWCSCSLDIAVCPGNLHFRNIYLALVFSVWWLIDILLVKVLYFM